MVNEMNKDNLHKLIDDTDTKYGGGHFWFFSDLVYHLIYNLVMRNSDLSSTITKAVDDSLTQQLVDIRRVQRERGHEYVKRIMRKGE